MSTVSFKQINYIADMLVKLELPLRILDGTGKPYVVDRAKYIKWSMEHREHSWAEEVIDKLKPLLTQLTHTTEVEPATDKQKAWGKKLEVMKLGYSDFPWDTASKTEAWARINELNSMANIGRR